MFYLGIYCGENIDQTTIIILKQLLKNVKKHYQVKTIKRFPIGTIFFEIEKQIVKFYNDQQLIVKKRIFSQDRRPAKNVKAHPKIVIDFTNIEAGQIDGLRKRKISVEGISIKNSENGWRKENQEIGLGNNYYVSRHDLMVNLLNVFEQKRLIIDKEAPFADNLIEELKNCKIELNTKNKKFSKVQREKEYNDIIMALAAPVWFRETIRYSRTYATSSRECGFI